MFNIDNNIELKEAKSDLNVKCEESKHSQTDITICCISHSQQLCVERLCSYLLRAAFLSRIRNTSGDVQRTVFVYAICNILKYPFANAWKRVWTDDFHFLYSYWMQNFVFQHVRCGWRAVSAPSCKHPFKFVSKVTWVEKRDKQTICRRKIDIVQFEICFKKIPLYF